MKAVRTHIDENLSEHLERIRGLIKRPSISTENLGIVEMAEYLRSVFADLGCQEVEVFETPGHPIVYGHFDAGAEKTLIIYLMYDTVAIMPDEEWIAPPMEGQLVDLPDLGRCVIGRGAVNTKGPLQAFVNAVESVLAVHGTLPVNLKFVAEGEEEMASRNLGGFLANNVERLAADALFFPSARQQDSGRAMITLASRRGITFELESNSKSWGRGPEWEIHAGQGALIDNPMWRLVEALNCLVEKNATEVKVPGFYDGILPPDEEQSDLLDRLALQWDEEAHKRSHGTTAFIGDLSGRDALERLLFRPYLGIRGFYGGDNRPGGVTVTQAIIPHRAVCKIGGSLVPDQDKYEIADRIRKHLDDNGYEDIIMRMRESPNPDSDDTWRRVYADDPVVEALVKTYEGMGIEAEIWPRSAGGWPGHLFQKYLGTSFISGGAGRGGSAHAPNEYLVFEGREGVAGLADLEESYARFLFEYAR